MSQKISWIIPKKRHLQLTSAPSHVHITPTYTQKHTQYTCMNNYIHSNPFTIYMYIYNIYAYNTKHMNHICMCMWSIVYIHIYIYMCVYILYIHIYAPSAKIPLLINSNSKPSTRLDCKDFLLEFSIYIQKQGLFCHGGLNENCSL